MRRHSLHGPVVVILALVTVGVLKSSSVLADDLDFTNITDVLSGKRQLLRVDDLAVVADLQPRPSVQVTNAVVLQTDNAKIVKLLLPDTPGGAVGGYGPPSRVAMGRVFNLANDVVAIALGFSEGTSQTLAVVLRDAVQGQNYSWALENAPIASPEFKAVLLADFNQDGMMCSLLMGRPSVIPIR